MEIYSTKHHRITTKPTKWGILIHEIPSLDLSQITHSSCALMGDLDETQFRDVIIKIHPLTGFCLILRQLILPK